MANIHVPGTLLTLTAATAHTINAGQTGQLVSLHLTNVDPAQERNAIVHFVPSGGSAAVGNRIIDTSQGSRLRPGVPQEFVFEAYLAPGDKIQWLSDAANVVAASADIRETNDDASEYQRVNTAYLPTTLTSLYTVPGGVATKMISVILCNQSATARQVELQFVGPGGSPSDKWKVLAMVAGTADLAAGETRAYRWPERYLPSGATVHAKADAVNSVSCYMSFRLV